MVAISNIMMRYRAKILEKCIRRHVIILVYFVAKCDEANMTIYRTNMSNNARLYL